MSSPEPGGRWDGWDDPDYTPARAELEEPITLPGIEDATPRGPGPRHHAPYQRSNPAALLTIPDSYAT